MKSKQYMVAIAEDYPRAVAQFHRPPRMQGKTLRSRTHKIRQGNSKELELTELEAWSLNNKPGVTVTGAPEIDPRPWEARCLGNADHEALRSTRLAVKAAEADLRKARGDDEKAEAQEYVDDAEAALALLIETKNAEMNKADKARVKAAKTAEASAQKAASGDKKDFDAKAEEVTHG